MNENELPEIPNIENSELLHAISALANSADIIRKILYSVLDGKPKDEVFSEHLELLTVADKVIDTWTQHMDELRIKTTFSDN